MNFKKNFEAPHKIIEKDLGNGKRYTASVPEKFCCEEFYILLENGFVRMDKQPSKDGLSEYPMITILNWDKDEHGEIHSTIRCLSHCMFCGYPF
jgi:hypothetical protein